jgi:hypothetical protein
MCFRAGTDFMLSRRDLFIQIDVGYGFADQLAIHGNIHLGRAPKGFIAININMIGARSSFISRSGASFHDRGQVR